MVQRDARLGLIAALVGITIFASSSRAQSPASPSNHEIQLLISLRQPFVAEPEAARIVMHIHNSSRQTVWLYRRARGKHPQELVIQEQNQPVKSGGGSTVEVKLMPADLQALQSVVTPAEATVLEYALMPKPRLIKLLAGGDYEETSIVHLQPALADGQKPIWGAYQATLTYAASFSNAEIFQHTLETDLWQGQIVSNTITIDLRPPLPGSVGVLSGTAVGKDLQPRAGVRVSLSDKDGQLIDQQITEADGRFSFAHLPMALYWIIGRREDATEDTVTYHHQELAASLPSASVQLNFFPPQGENPAAFHDGRLGPIMTPVFEGPNPKSLVHKPVLIRVFDPSGKPVGGVELDAIFSSEDVIDEVKAVTSDDGTAAMELLPGRNSFSLKKRGCLEQAERADVSPGKGVDGFKYIYNCAKK